MISFLTYVVFYHPGIAKLFEPLRPVTENIFSERNLRQWACPLCIIWKWSVRGRHKMTGGPWVLFPRCRHWGSARHSTFQNEGIKLQFSTTFIRFLQNCITAVRIHLRTGVKDRWLVTIKAREVFRLDCRLDDALRRGFCALRNVQSGSVAQSASWGLFPRE